MIERTLVDDRIGPCVRDHGLRATANMVDHIGCMKHREIGRLRGRLRNHLPRASRSRGNGGQTGARRRGSGGNRVHEGGSISQDGSVDDPFDPLR